jgi:hypothetical protein
MKRTLLSIFILFINVSCSHINPYDSLTKEELIERLIVVTKAEATFYETIEKVINKYQTSGGLAAETVDVMRKYLTWESWKPYYVASINDTCTRDELERMVCYQAALPSGSDWMVKKHLDIELNALLARKEWEKALWAKIKPALHDLPRKTEESPVTYAGAWKSLSERDKLLYIKGVKDGTHTTINCNIGKLSLVMDELYGDEKNQNITYYEILRLAEQKLQGEDTSSVLPQ